VVFIYKMSYYGIRLPKILHKTLSVKNKRLIIIGDVHGCFDELLDLLKKVNYDSKNDLPILVGDLTMKGPKSLEVIQYCTKNNINAVRGNVDENSLANYEKLSQGNSENWENYEWMKQLTKKELEYMYELPYTIYLKEINSIVVHAGLDPKKELIDQDPKIIVRMRHIQNGIPTSKPTKGEPWINYYNKQPHVYFGHDARKKLQQTPYVTGLDTACVYGHRLTACVINDNQKKLISVNARKTYKQ